MSEKCVYLELSLLFVISKKHSQSDLKLPLKRLIVGKMDFNLEERKLGTAHQLLQKDTISKPFCKLQFKNFCFGSILFLYLALGVLLFMKICNLILIYRLFVKVVYL